MACDTHPSVQALKIVRITIAARLGALLALHQAASLAQLGHLGLTFGQHLRQIGKALTDLDGALLERLGLPELDQLSKAKGMQKSTPSRAKRHQPRRFVVDLRVVPTAPRALIGAARPLFLP
jgi:hypothetical protein